MRSTPYITVITKSSTWEGITLLFPNSLDLSSSFLENENRFHQT